MELVRDVLQAKGYRTLEATSGEAALELVAEAGAGPDPARHPAAGNRRRRPRSSGCRADAGHRRDDRRRAHGAGDGGRPGVVPRRRLRRLHLEADRRPGVHPGGRGVLRWRADGAGRILVVDDIPENLRLMEAVLVPRGYTVLTATSGEQALELVEREQPGPDPARRRHAGDGRLRGLPDAPGGRGHRRAAGDHGHLEHRPREEEGDRGRAPTTSSRSRSTTTSCSSA